jgi:transcriptional regulator of acetoin/glycerol metabolism
MTHERDLDRLLKENQNLIAASKPVLKKIIENISVQHKIIFLCDKDGYIINIFGEVDLIQYFFEQAVKLGTSLSRNSCGTTAVGTVLESAEISVIYKQQYCYPALKNWTSLATPIKIKGKLQGVICLYLRTEKELEHAKILLEVVSDFVTTILKQGYKDPIEKLLFFGQLILDTRFNLTPREIEVLYRLKSGQQLADLPEKMLLSPNTVKSHVKSIYGKMQVNSLGECLRFVDEILLKKRNPG